MAKYYCNQTLIVLLMSIGALLLSCSSSKPNLEPPIEPEKPNTVSIVVDNQYDNDPKGDQLSKLDSAHKSMAAIVVEQNLVTKIYPQLNLDAISNTVDVDPTKQYDLFVVTNANIAGITEGVSTKQELVALMGEPIGDKNPLAIVSSGAVHIDANIKAVDVKLKRMVARLDVKVNGIDLYAINITGAQSKSYIFASNLQPEQQLIEINKTFATPLTASTKGVVYLNSQSTASLGIVVDCAIAGSANRQRITIPIPYAKIERNNIYVATISAGDIKPEEPPVEPEKPPVEPEKPPVEPEKPPIEPEKPPVEPEKPPVEPEKPPVEPEKPPVEPEKPPVEPKVIVVKFEQLPWNDQDIDVGYPDLNAGVDIDAARFVYDHNNVDFDAAKRKIKISYRGAKLTIPFVGAFDKVVTLVGANSKVTLTATSGTRYKNDEVNIEAVQPTNAGSYSFTINAKNAFAPLSQGVNYVVEVDKSEPPSVIMGGVEWMAFNAGSGKEYPILGFGQTVRDFYKSNWGDFVYMCEWGERPNPTIFLAPSVENARPGMDRAGNLLNQAPGLTWINKVPCPEGWRLPTIGEMWRIWPPQGWAVNATPIKYTVSNVEYTAQIQESGAVYQYSGANKPTKMLVIKQGDNELLFPLAGYRKRQDYDGVSKTPVEVGSSGFYWSDAIGNPTWNARVKGISNGTSWNGDGGNQFELYGSWNMVRCVRNL